MKKKYEHKAGIYSIVHILTGRLYVGQASDLPQRWTDHKRSLRRGVHSSKGLQTAWDTDGVEAFVFNILEVCEKDRVILAEREEVWRQKLQPVWSTPKATRSRLGVKSPQDIPFCPVGHPYNEVNTGYSTRNQRYCRECARIRVAKAIAAETPEQTEARLAKSRDYHEQNHEQHLATMAKYTATHKEEKRAYDQSRKKITKKRDKERRSQPEFKVRAAELQRIRLASETDEHRQHRLAKQAERRVAHKDEHHEYDLKRNQEERVAKGLPPEPNSTCRKGHPWTPENTIQEKNRRLCRTCRDQRKANESPEHKAELQQARYERERESWPEKNRIAYLKRKEHKVTG